MKFCGCRKNREKQLFRTLERVRKKAKIISRVHAQMQRCPGPNRVLFLGAGEICQIHGFGTLFDKRPALRIRAERR